MISRFSFVNNVGSAREVLERFGNEYVDNIEKDKLLHDFIGSVFYNITKEILFLTSCFDALKKWKS